MVKKSEKYFDETKLTNIKSWIRFEIPRLASMNSLVSGPGIPAV